MKAMKCLERARPIPAPMAIAMAELISRFRRSTKWSKKDIRAPGSSGAAAGEAAGSSWAGSDIVRFFGLGVGPFARVQLLSSKVELLRRSSRGFDERGGVGTVGLHRSRRRGQILDAVGGIGGRGVAFGRDRQSGHQAALANRIFGSGLEVRRLGRDLAGGLVFARFAQVSLALEVAHMAFKRRAQVACRTAKFAHDFAQVPGKIWQLFRPKDDQGDHENDDDMCDAEHSCPVVTRPCQYYARSELARCFRAAFEINHTIYAEPKWDGLRQITE